MCKRRRIDRGNNTNKRFQHKGAFKIQQIMIRFKKYFLFLFSFLFKIPAILSQQEASNINVSQQSFSSFFFFFLSFPLAWVKVSKQPDWSMWHSSFTDLLVMKQNLFSFSLSFLNTNNFPIFRNCRRKTV